MNWNAAEEVAEVAAAEYDLCIASDVACTAVQLLHRPTLSATPSPHTRSSPHPLQLASPPSPGRLLLPGRRAPRSRAARYRGYHLRHRRADAPVRHTCARARAPRGRAQV